MAKSLAFQPAAKGDRLLETHPLPDWVEAAKPGIGWSLWGGLVAATSSALPQLPAQGRDGGGSLASGTAHRELEAADSADAARRPSVPAGPLPLACGRCDQRAKRGAEAGREAESTSGPQGLLALLCGRLSVALPSAPPAVAAGAQERELASTSPLWRQQILAFELDKESETRKAAGRLMVFWWRIGRATRVCQKDP